MSPTSQGCNRVVILSACSSPRYSRLTGFENHAVGDKRSWGHAFLTEGGVFTEDLIETWVDYKRTNEIDPIRLRPTPYEFELYYGI